MNQALRPNVEFDEENTKKRRDEARSKVGDVIVKIRAGDTLVDSDTTPSPLITEKIKAYKAELQKRGTTSTLKTSSVEFIFCLLLMTMGALFLVISKTQKNRRPRTIAIFCTLLLLNLALERTLVEMGNAGVLRLEHAHDANPRVRRPDYARPDYPSAAVRLLHGLHHGVDGGGSNDGDGRRRHYILCDISGVGARRNLLLRGGFDPPAGDFGGRHLRAVHRGDFVRHRQLRGAFDFDCLEAVALGGRLRRVDRGLWRSRFCRSWKESSTGTRT